MGKQVVRMAAPGSALKTKIDVTSIAQTAEKIARASCRNVAI
jgi:hypothetical protein